MEHFYFLLLVGLACSEELLTSRGQETEQSSIGWCGFSDLAIDGGIRDGNYHIGGDNTCTHTFKDVSNWWWVNLGEEKAVSRVVVYNRMDAYQERLDHTKVYVDSHVCGEIRVSKGSEKYEINCGGAVGSSVMLRQDGINGYLTVCEVEVYGDAPPEGNPVHDLARDRPTQQSSVDKAMNGVSSKAVDGLWDSTSQASQEGEKCWKKSSKQPWNCALTDGSSGGAWWTVDLAARSNVQAVMIYNRLDYGSWRLHGAEVLVGTGKTSCGKVNMRQSGVNDRTGVFILRCPEGTVGDSVLIRKYTSGALALCEVKVIGNRVE